MELPVAIKQKARDRWVKVHTRSDRFDSSLLSRVLLSTIPLNRTRLHPSRCQILSKDLELPDLARETGRLFWIAIVARTSADTTTETLAGLARAGAPAAQQ